MTVQELRDFLALANPDAIVLDQFGEPITGFRTCMDGVAEVILESGK